MPAPPVDVAASWPTNPEEVDGAVAEETLSEAKRRCAAAIKILIGEHHSSLNDIVAATAADMAYRLIMAICEFVSGTGIAMITMGSSMVVAELDPADDDLGLKSIYAARHAAREAFFAEEDLRASGKHPKA